MRIMRCLFKASVSIVPSLIGFIAFAAGAEEVSNQRLSHTQSLILFNLHNSVTVDQAIELSGFQENNDDLNIYSREPKISTQPRFYNDVIGANNFVLTASASEKGSGANVVDGVGLDQDATAKVQQFLDRAQRGVTIKFTETAKPIVITAPLVLRAPRNSKIDFNGVQLIYRDIRPSRSGQVSALSISGEYFEIDNLDLACDNDFQQYSGLAISRSVHVVIRRAHISNCRWAGLTIFDPEAGTSKFVTVLDGEFPRNRFGIFTNGSNILLKSVNTSYDWRTTVEGVRGNEIWHPDSQYYDGIIVSAGEDITITNCKASGAGQSGIYVGAVTRIQIRGCVIKNNMNKGIDIGPVGGFSKAVVISNNTLENNATGDISLYGVLGGYVTANVIRSTGSEFGIALQSATTGVRIFGNCIQTNGPKVFIEGKTDRHALGNTVVGDIESGRSGHWLLNPSENQIVSTFKTYETC